MSQATDIDDAVATTSMGSTDLPTRHPREGGDPWTLESTSNPATAAVPEATAIPSDSTGAFAQVTTSVDTTAAQVAMPASPANTHTASVAQPTTFAPATSSAGAVGGGVLALLLVVGLILALAWLAKRMPGIGVAGAGNPALRVVGSLALGPRDRVMVVEVGQTQLLLSVGPGGTRTLHTLDEPLPVAASNSPSPFAQILSQHFGKKP